MNNKALITGIAGLDYAYRGNSPGLAILVLFGAFAGLVLGLLAVVFPWFVFVPLFAVPVFILIAWVRPEYALAFLVLVVSGFLPDFLLPSISTIAGKLRAEDFFLGFVLLITLLKYGGDAKRWLPGLKPFVWPLLLLMGLAGFSAIYAVLIAGVATTAVTEDLRAFVYWVLPLIIVMMVHQRRVLDRFLLALVVGAVLLALAQVLQVNFGIQVIHAGRLETAVIGHTEYSGVLRSTVPGIYLIIFAFLFIVSRYILGKQGLFVSLLLSGLFALALMYTYGRTIWGTTIFGLMFVGFLLGIARTIKVGMLLLVVVLGGLTVVSLFKPEVADVVIERAMSIKDEGDSRTSLGWRFEENGLALKRIQSSPLFGIGLGVNYKPAGFEKEWEGERRTVHNGHMAILLKLGLAGAGALVFLLVRYWKEATLLARSLAQQSSDRAVVTVIRALVPMVLISANTRPEWIVQATVCMFAVGIGTVAAMNNLRRQASKGGMPDQPRLLASRKISWQ